MSPIKIFMYVLGMIMFMLVIFITAQLFLAFRVTIDTRHLERFSTELSENIFSSSLTVSRAVFKVEELDKFNSPEHKAFQYDKSINSGGVDIGGEEPYVRQCRYGYNLRIVDSNTNNVWEIGYFIRQHGNEIASATPIEYPVGIAYPRVDKKGYDIHPGKLTVSVYHTWLSEITCMIEDAWRFKQIRTIRIPCLKLAPAGTCGIPIWRSEVNKDYICVFHMSPEHQPDGDDDCRFLPGIPLVKFDKIYTPSSESDGSRILKAVPIKEGAEVSCADTPDNKLADRVPTGNEKVQTIILCLGGGPGEEKKKQEESKPGDWKVCCASITNVIGGNRMETMTFYCREKSCGSYSMPIDSCAGQETTATSLSSCRNELTKRKQSFTNEGWSVDVDNIQTDVTDAIKIQLTKKVGP